MFIEMIGHLIAVNFAIQRLPIRMLYGPSVPKALEEQRAAIEGKRGGSICAISAIDGKPLGKITVSAPPVWDGLAADNGRIYMATTDGNVSCYAGKN